MPISDVLKAAAPINAGRAISFIIDPNVVTATKKDIEDHDASKTAHAAEFEKKADVTDLNAHANNTDIHVNPSTMGNFGADRT